MALRRGLAYMEEERTKTTECLSLNGHALLWYRINDVVMGGHSQSTISKTADGALAFARLCWQHLSRGWRVRHGVDR